MIKVKVLTKGKLKSAWKISVFLAVKAVFSQVVNCLLVNVVVSKAFKDFI